MTADEVSAFTGLSVSTLNRHALGKLMPKIPSVPRGTRGRLYRRATVEAWLDELEAYSINGGTLAKSELVRSAGKENHARQEKEISNGMPSQCSRKLDREVLRRGRQTTHRNGGPFGGTGPDIKERSGEEALGSDAGYKQ